MWEDFLCGIDLTLLEDTLHQYTKYPIVSYGVGMKKNAKLFLCEIQGFLAKKYISFCTTVMVVGKRHINSSKIKRFNLMKCSIEKLQKNF